jgi:haloalkane dehalogenase
MKYSIPILIITVMSKITLAQPWVDTALYPFESKYLQLETGKMHYVDEGKGETILFIHGTPTWSFLYRDFIRTLSKGYRCIAIDHLGFGLSESPSDSPGTPEWHAQNLSGFIQKMGLRDITLVVHDFGGPIGLAAGSEHPDRIKRVVMFNTWLWATKDRKDVQKIDKLVNGWLGKYLYLNMNFSPKVLLKKGFADKQNLGKAVHNHYTKPFPNKVSRHALLHLAQALAGSSDWYQAQWEQLDWLSSKPCLILWGTEDKFIDTGNFQKWKERFPHARSRSFNCGHFVQEERTEESVKAIAAMMARD